MDPASIRQEASASGVTGRGGASFPLARKLELAARSPGSPIIVVNASEGEPASRKDQTLLSLRPHLVLDGAAVAAFAVEATDVVVFLHRHRARLHRAVTRALDERGPGSWPDGVQVQVVRGPDTYLAGESSAAASFLNGEGAFPRARSAPLAALGVDGRPTVVSNAETLAHLALIARFGADWFRQAGGANAPGSTLVTLAGVVTHPGLVVEILRPVRIGEPLAAVGGWPYPPRAVLLGGYAGTWVEGRRAWEAPLDRHQLATGGADLGCGVIGALNRERCGLAETARLAAWLDAESAGQCGPCAHGMPALTRQLHDLVARRATGRDVASIQDLAESIVQRGLCHLPDGAAALVHSAFETFREEVKSHRSFHHRCNKRHEDAGSPFPLPQRLVS
jgi:NADH:ubiquinone oxidoreductase subunit F (NADH-binding)